MNDCYQEQWTVQDVVMAVKVSASVSQVSSSEETSQSRSEQ